MNFFIFDFLVIALHFLFGKNHFLNLDFDYNLPNFYSAFKFLLVAFFVYLIFLKNKKANWSVRILFLLLIYLGLDDALALHEKYGSIIFYKIFPHSTLATFYSERLAGFSWYPICFLPIILIFLFLFYFWRRGLQPLKPRVAKYFLFGIICLVIAFILEPIGSLLWPYQKIYQVGMVLEESLELFASSFFLSSLFLILKKKR